MRIRLFASSSFFFLPIDIRDTMSRSCCNWYYSSSEISILPISEPLLLLLLST